MDYEDFKRSFEELSGIDLDLYKEDQMKRRINKLIERKRLNGYEAFTERLKADRAELEAFTDYITINVTAFFRTPEHWSVLESDVLPALLSNTSGTLNIWSCACSTGEEPWSLAMSLGMLAEPSRFHILATDIDNRVLNAARAGVYSPASTAAVPPGMLERFFEKTSGGYRISDALRPAVEFRRLDLLKDPYPAGCDLIVCRNVLIYFTGDAKEAMYKKLKASLSTGGYLFTGNTEQIIYYKQYGLRKLSSFMYANDLK